MRTILIVGLIIVNVALAAASFARAPAAQPYGTSPWRDCCKGDERGAYCCRDCCFDGFRLRQLRPKLAVMA